MVRERRCGLTRLFSVATFEIASHRSMALLTSCQRKGRVRHLPEEGMPECKLLIALMPRRGLGSNQTLGFEEQDRPGDSGRISEEGFKRAPPKSSPRDRRFQNHPALELWQLVQPRGDDRPDRRRHIPERGRLASLRPNQLFDE